MRPRGLCDRVFTGLYFIANVLAKNSKLNDRPGALLALAKPAANKKPPNDLRVNALRAHRRRLCSVAMYIFIRVRCVFGLLLVRRRYYRALFLQPQIEKLKLHTRNATREH